MTTYTSFSDDFPNLKSFESFPAIAKIGYVTVCEVNGELHLSHSSDPENPATAAGFTRLTENYIPICKADSKPIKCRKIPSIKTTISDESYLIQTTEKGLKSVWNGWMDGGFVGAVEALRRSGVPEILISLLTKITETTKLIAGTKRAIKIKLYPHLALSPDDLIDAFAPIRGWSKSWIRALEWHPELPKLAIALHDDTIRVLLNEMCSEDSDVTPFLKAPEQRLVSTMSWHPCLSELAVGVEGGIVIWKVPASLKVGHATSEFVTAEGHCPVTSVKYSCTGSFLVSTSSADTSLLVWETCSWDYAALHRLSGGGIPRAMWSPDSSKIFATSPTSLFRVWISSEDTGFEPKSWSTASSPVTACTWHPSGSLVVFACDDIIYCLNFKPPSVEFTTSPTPPQMHPLFDMRKCVVPQLDSDTVFRVGGRVVDMEWDPTGKRLAVLFADSEVVALFRVIPSSIIALAPFGFIRGHDGEFPLAISFQNAFGPGAMLTIAWSTERLQYFPFIFAELNAQTNYANQVQVSSMSTVGAVSESPIVNPFYTPSPATIEDNLRFRLFSPVD